MKTHVRPTYPHRCRTCTFLGPHLVLDKTYDLYVCQREVHGVRVTVLVARRSPWDVTSCAAGSQHVSRLGDTDEAVLEQAWQRARARGLVRGDGP